MDTLGGTETATTHETGLAHGGHLGRRTEGNSYRAAVG